LSIIVVIKPDRAGGPPRRSNASSIGNIRERAVVIIVVENVTAVIGYVEVLPSVSVVVSDGDPHSESAACQPGPVGDISECSVVVVVIEGILEGCCWSIEVRCSTVYQIDIHPSIVVVVKEGTTSADGLGQMVLNRMGIIVDPRDPARLWGYLFKCDAGLTRAWLQPSWRARRRRNGKNNDECCGYNSFLHIRFPVASDARGPLFRGRIKLLPSLDPDEAIDSTRIGRRRNNDDVSLSGSIAPPVQLFDDTHFLPGSRRVFESGI